MEGESWHESWVNNVSHRHATSLWISPELGLFETLVWGVRSKKERERARLESLSCLVLSLNLRFAVRQSSVRHSVRRGREDDGKEFQGVITPPTSRVRCVFLGHLEWNKSELYFDTNQQYLIMAKVVFHSTSRHALPNPWTPTSCSDKENRSLEPQFSFLADNKWQSSNSKAVRFQSWQSVHANSKEAVTLKAASLTNEQRTPKLSCTPPSCSAVI